MKTHQSLARITKVYTPLDQSDWANTALVRHDGVVIAFAQNTSGRFYYSILNFSSAEEGKFKDVDFWDTQPQELEFPVEVVMAGMEAASQYELPVYKRNGCAADPSEFVAIQQRHPYKSTTACLSQAGAPFKVLSDGRYVYLFRQSGEQLDNGPQLEPAILMDRFVFNGTTIKRKLEQRYQRSRNKSIPQSRKDTLGYEDLNKMPFYEPTHRLGSLLGKVKNGNFAVTLVPSMVPDEQNWLFFFHDEEKSQIGCINLSRADDGLFDERGIVFYVSQDRVKHPEIFTTIPGNDPDGSALVAWKTAAADMDGGKQSFAIPLPGNTPACRGLDVVVYARQGISRSSGGYDSEPKPVLRQQRVLLAINTQAAGEPKPRLMVLDFGLSNDGRLASVGTDGFVNLGPLTDNQQAGNRDIFEKLAPLQQERDFLQIEPDIAHIKTDLDTASRDFNDFLNKHQVRLYWQTPRSTTDDQHKKDISYRADIATFNESDLVFKQDLENIFNENGTSWVEDVEALDIIGDLEVTLCRTEDNKSPVLTANTEQSTLDDLNGIGWRNQAKWIELQPIEKLKQQMLQFQREYRALELELKQKNLEKQNLPAEMQNLRPDQTSAKIEELDSQIDQLIRQGHWDIRLPMPNINVDLQRDLTIDGGILEIAGSNQPPQLAKNADGQVSLFFRGDDDQAFVLHYDAFSRGTGVTYPVPDSVRNLNGDCTLEIMFLLPQNADSEAETVFVFGGVDSAVEGGSDYAIWLDHKKDHIISYQNKIPLDIPLSDPHNQALIEKAQPNHLVIVSSGQHGNEAYINGKLAATVSNEIVMIPGKPTQFRLYQKSPDLPMFSGEIYGVAIWNGAKTAAEVASLYETGSLPVETEKPLFSTGAGKMHWVGNTPGLAVGSTKNGILAPEDKADNFGSPDQMTVETWINPLIKGNTYILSHPNYFIQLTAADEVSPITVLYSFYDKKGGLRKTLKAGEWSHLALAYQTAYGLKFDGHDYVSCGDSQTLNITRDLTIEVALQVEEPKKEQTILFKGEIGEEGEEIAYEMFIKDEKLIWRYSEDEGDDKALNTELDHTGITFEANKPTKIAVTREYKTDTEGLTKAIGSEGEHNIDISGFTYFLYSFYQDGELKKSYRASHGEPRGSEGKFIIGSRHAEESFFQGVIAEVRVWNVKRDAAKIHTHIDSSAAGLVSWWRMDENEGYVIEDAKTINPGNIIGAKWVKDPNPDAATIHAYVNGIRTSLEVDPKPVEPAGGFRAFGIGATASSSKEYHGMLEEIRIWSVARTDEQIQDNLFRRLDSEYDQLLAYYDCDVEGQQLLDRSGHNLHLDIQANQLEYSSAPIGVDLPIVRNALANLPTPFNSQTTGAPAAAEYGDMQKDSAGNEIGVLKRAYSIIHEGYWELVTGYKVGDLALEWVGQAQFDPQIIGFVEGAPPVPSENLIQEEGGYADAVSVQMTEAKSTMYAMGSSREKTAFVTASMSALVGASVESSAGIGAEVVVAELEAGLGVQGSLEFSSSWLDEAEVGFGKNLTKSSLMTLTGVLENEHAIKHHLVGRRFIPNNYGYALVQSETVDIFALRLKRSGIMVSKVLRKNPDIPQDWNIIMFPINKQYVKQGTLDGKVGHEADEDFPADRGYAANRSYFKPKEAYQLKQAIERQEQIAREMYQRFDSHQLGIMDRPGLPDLSKRDIANTYVWTAEGGLFAETTETIDTVQEVAAGTFSTVAAAGVIAEWDFSEAGVRTAGNLEIMVGGGLTTTVTKSVGVEEGFGLEVNVGIDRDIYQRDEQHNIVYDAGGNPRKVPGKVDAYRFMTFYLSPNNRHLLELGNQVVDPSWLQSSDPDAAAMRKALQSDKAAPWRILHRVTFISRVYAADAVPAPETADEQHQLSERTIASNYDIIQALEPSITHNDHTSYDQLASTIRSAIQQSPDLKRYSDRTNAIIQLMSEYLGIFPSAS